MHIHGECFIYKDTNTLRKWYVITRDGHRSKVGGHLTYLRFGTNGSELSFISFIFTLLSLINSATPSIQSFQPWTRELASLREGDLTYLRLGTNGNEFSFIILSYINSATFSIQSFKLWTRAGKSEGILKL